MESFLSGRPTVAKLKSSSDRAFAAGDGFSPMFEGRVPAAASPGSSGGGFVPTAPPINGSGTPVLSPGGAAVTSGSASEVAPHTHQVSVEVVRADGAVQAIVVTCRCGERIELDCVY